ncbi:PASTA domain-containing protein [Bacillus licheniformis]|nr:PASTA domain-containing protein [Bacillus licheniformis]
MHDEEEAGTIIEQDPAAGTEIVAADDEVKLTVSLGPEAITLRDLKHTANRRLRAIWTTISLSLSKGGAF